MFAHVDDVGVSLFDALPTNWRNVSNLAVLTTDQLQKLNWFPVVEGDKPVFDPLSEVLVPKSVVQGDHVRIDYAKRPATPDEIKFARQQANAASLAELASLDVSIPRGLEDFYLASGFDITKLPAASRDKLQRKAVLRAGLK